MNPDSAVAFRRCQTLRGRSEPLNIGRRNGQFVAFFGPNWKTDGPEPNLPFPWLDDTRLYVNLNDLEQRTWRQILSGISISAIAIDEGVSRTAIYQRIEGNRFGHGGMIGKNFWVLLWWRLRRQRVHGGRP